MSVNLSGVRKGKGPWGRFAEKGMGETGFQIPFPGALDNDTHVALCS